MSEEEPLRNDQPRVRKDAIGTRCFRFPFAALRVRVSINGREGVNV